MVALSRAHAAVTASTSRTGWRRSGLAPRGIRIGTFRTLAAATVAWSVNVDSPASNQEGQTMEQTWTYSLWGAVAGAAALAVVGFTWGGWVTGGQAEAMTLKRSEAAVVAALTPICIERFQVVAPRLYRERRMGDLRPGPAIRIGGRLR
jgi:hypothetical protein